MNKTSITKNFLEQQYLILKKSMPQIAKEINCSSVTVLYHLKKHNIKTRTISESKMGHKGLVKENNPNWKCGKPKCQVCGKILSFYSYKLCKNCYTEKTKKNIKCIDCGKEIGNKSKRCRSCANKDKKCNWYKDGRTKKTFLCKQCGINKIQTQTYYKGSGLCRSCANSGTNAPGYKHGKCLTYPKCVDCNKQLGNYHAKRCSSCASKFIWTDKKYRETITNAAKAQWQNEEIRNRNSKAIRLALDISPNKPEKALNKLLQQLLPAEYKFVGDGQVIINGFNPDFINCNGQKKIIEMFGDYWHKIPKVKRRDYLRFKTYKKYGYKTLVVWEHELNDKFALINKVETFNNKEGKI